MVPADSHGIPRAPQYLGNPLRDRTTFAYRAVTFFGWPSQALRLAAGFVTLWTRGSGSAQLPQHRPCNARQLEHMNGLGSSRFARRYSGNHYCFLFQEVLRWFTSLRWLHAPMDSVQGYWTLLQQGSPIRKSPDQRLLAAPRGLSQLATSFVAYLRQGILRTPLVA